MNMIHVPAQKILINKEVFVDSFFIRSEPVSAAEFALYSNKVKKITLAEENGSEFNVYNNPTLDNIPVSALTELPALFISYLEAHDFCQYFNVKLPSRCQWVSFLKYVYDNDLYANRKILVNNFSNKSNIAFSCSEWLGSAGKLLLGKPLMMRICGLPKPTIDHASLVKVSNGSVGNISIAFRFVINDKNPQQTKRDTVDLMLKSPRKK